MRASYSPPFARPSGMAEMVGKPTFQELVSPSPFVSKFSRTIATNAKGPILDVACGSGRHAFLLASLGATVIGVDRDLKSFREMQRRLAEIIGFRCAVKSHQVDLNVDPWGFKRSSLGAIINVHFLLPKLFPLFCRSLAPGGYFLFESVGGQGRNYLELPHAGEMEKTLRDCFDFDHYEERGVGPKGQDAVAVRLLARRRDRPRPFQQGANPLA